MELGPLIQLFYDLFVNYAFGSVLLSGAFFAVIIVYWGIKKNWSIDGFAVTLTPLFIFLGIYTLPLEFKVLTAIIGGFLLAYELYRIAAR